uniref:Uncharacterized protein n=1 Tax=Rhizophora mucronata TaxID=61149 RepID=A0A2P2N5W4_RHIMU
MMPFCKSQFIPSYGSNAEGQFIKKMKIEYCPAFRNMLITCSFCFSFLVWGIQND